MKRQKSFLNDQPTLYLVATPIGNLDEMNQRAIDILQKVDVIACEDTRHTGELLAHFNIHNRVVAHHLYNEKTSTEGIINLLAEGQNVALVSDAGYPLISDPGALLVSRCVSEGYNVVTVNGASAFLTALTASGLKPQPFTFVGFLSANSNEAARQLETYVSYPDTLIFYEAPHRIKRTLELIRQVMGDRQICLGRELTKYYEEYIRGTVSEVLSVIEEVKGEIVVVVQGAGKPYIAIEELDINKVVEEYIASGMTASTAIKQAAEDYNLSKNEVYKKFLQSRNCN